MRAFGLVALTSVVIVGAAIGVTAREEPLFGPMTPARVEGTWVYMERDEEDQVEQLGEYMYVTTAVGSYAVASNDPRLRGTATMTGELMGYYPPALLSVAEADWLVEDEAGAWTGSHRSLVSMGDEDPLNVEWQLILEGSGPYEGLTAFLVVDYETQAFIGAIIPDEMPELPADWLEIYQSAYEEDPASDG